MFIPVAALLLRTMPASPQRPPAAVLLLLVSCLSGSLSIPDPRLREALIQLEDGMQAGGKIKLTDAEKRLDDQLFKMKQEEMGRPDFLPAMHFFKARDLIRASPIFSVLQKMPKGGALHLHDFSIVDVEWLVKNVTYRPNCYMCFTDKQSVRFIFSSQWPKPRPQCSPWVLLENLRAKTGNTTELDNSIMNNLTLFTDEDPEAVYPSQDVVWDRFEQTFQAVWGLVTYVPVFRDYFYRGLGLFYADNVMYLEVRVLLPELYELDGSTHDKTFTLKVYQDVTEQFTAKYPDFFGVRFISSVPRAVNVSVMTEAVEEAMKLQKDFPHIMAGFDMAVRIRADRCGTSERPCRCLRREASTSLSSFMQEKQILRGQTWIRTCWTLFSSTRPASATDLPSFAIRWPKICPGRARWRWKCVPSPTRC
ncbi:adenosine deaminase 2-A-like isoform X3 [Salarias fasciatus]|uniref:adenosine deaminase 2-A-like isoform X3 n=1 Tax=Salarias fasciatus TaxID=181472 RepID=UPI001176A1FE|nr:adenosine deaminase 2-A-like isoform X3 [Salarias fasciatus]XP_029952589.1 adenosine deaminase 2-A-like isoform X3 [Salarias fasciatus]